jgi:hypothetical protein
MNTTDWMTEALDFDTAEMYGFCGNLTDGSEPATVADAMAKLGKLHLYPVYDGFLVEEDETFRLLAHDPNAPVAWGFTRSADAATVFPTAREALVAAQPWMVTR